MIERIIFDKINTKTLINIFAQFKNSIDLKELNLSEDLIKSVRVEYGNSLIIDKIFNKIKDDGYALIDLNSSINDLNLIDLKKIITIFISLFLTPIGVFGSQGIVREIGVNMNKNINSSTGVGHIPFHTDFNNTSSPPPFSILYCHRTDPFKGGESIISNFNDSLIELSEDEKLILLKPIFKEGEFYNLFNVGHKLNLFPVFDVNSNVIRYSTKLKSEEESVTSLWNLRKALIKNQKTFMLNKGELLILNQKVFVHARHSLNGNQSQLRKDESRFLLQYFAK